MIDKDGKKIKLVLKEFRLDEISAVDFPAQQPAKAVLMKRHEPEDTPDLGKKESDEQAPASSEENPNAGNVQKAGDDPMNEDEKKQLDELAKKLAKAEAVLALSTEQRAHYDGLAEDEQEAFLGKGAEDRDKVVKAALAKKAEAETVEYTDMEGNKFLKSDDPRLIAMAKRADEERKARLEAEGLRKADELKKRASELKHLPGEESTKVALLKALDTLEGEEHDKALEILKAHDGGLGEAFEKKGTTAGKEESGDAATRFDELVKKAKEEDKTLSEAKAIVKVMDTEEGMRLHAEMNGR
jgi:hypothetical protein